MKKEQILEIARKVLTASDADQTEALILFQRRELTRFANSIIHQNTMEEDSTLTLRLIKGKRIGLATTNILDEESIERAVKKASDMASLSPENNDFQTLPGPKPYTELNAYFESTAQATPEERAEGVRALVNRIKGHDIKAAGAFSTSHAGFAVVNSLGVEAFTENTSASFSTVLLSPSSAGYAARESPDICAIDVDGLAEEALKRVLDGRNPRTIEVKEMETVFSPYAVAEMLEYLAYMGLGALSVQEGRSFMNEAMGKQVVSEKITLWDDGMDPRGYPQPIDFEGQPKRKVVFFDKGVAREVVYDSLTAFKEGKESTGHALPQPNSYGPLPINLFLEPGDATMEDMIRSTEDGVLVTRFWYVRPVHPKLTVITGMTRDGTFKIENGKIAYPICNLRCTASILETLRQVEMVGKDVVLTQADIGLSDYVPALKVKSFKFTGQTTF